MKHIFVINSHTTFLSVMGIVEHLRQNNCNVDEDIMFFLVRNYNNKYIDRSIKTVEMSPLSYESEDVFKSRSFHLILIQKLIRKVDKTIDDLIPETFHLYAPHLAHPLWMVLYTNKKCEYFSYVQESLAPYTKKRFIRQTPFLRKIENIIYDFATHGRMWYYRQWYVGDRIIDHSRVDSYAINDKYFKYLPVPQRYIKWPIPEIDINIEFKKDHMIFIYDAFVTHHILKSEDYIYMCKKLIDENASSYNYLKFHPGQSEKEIAKILDYFKKKKLDYYVLDNNVPFEYIIMKKNNLRLAGYGSTLLFLAHDYGHDVICKDNELMQFKMYRKYSANCGTMLYSESLVSTKNGRV